MSILPARMLKVREPDKSSLTGEVVTVSVC
jgi:hypothetical protein